MPIYEYKCLDCDTHIEKMQKISDAPLAICDKCGGRLEKQVSLSGFQFKGAGWYVTDYAKKSGGASSGKSDKSEGGERSEKSEKSEKNDSGEKTSAAESTAKTESASNSTSDAKPQAKTETTTKKE